jgi:hypothetical protein
MLAAQYGHTAVVLTLVKQGAALGALDNEGCTALELIAEGFDGCRDDCISILREALHQTWSPGNHRTWAPSDSQGVWAVLILLTCRGVQRVDCRAPRIVLLTDIVLVHVLPLLCREDFLLLANLGRGCSNGDNLSLPGTDGGIAISSIVPAALDAPAVQLSRKRPAVSSVTESFVATPAFKRQTTD